jgi:hypothetical protein
VSLSQDPAFSTLKRDFVCGWRDITSEPWSGISGHYETDDGAVFTTNGAGPHNIQMFVLAPDGTVLHCLPGYWEAHDLAEELGFGEKMLKVWRDPSLSRAQKDAKFKAMNLEHVGQHSKEMVARSEMQGFDKKFEARRERTSDCILHEDSMQPKFRPRKDDGFKTTDQIVHERMAARPFVPYSEFDVARFTDYGRQKYDKKQALLADLLPKSGPGAFRDRLADLIHDRMSRPKDGEGEVATDDRKAARKAALRDLFEAVLRSKRERAPVAKPEGG